MYYAKKLMDLAKWVISVDRRLVLMQVMHGHTIIKAKILL